MKFEQILVRFDAARDHRNVVCQSDHPSAILFSSGTQGLTPPKKNKLPPKLPFSAPPANVFL